MREIKDFPPNIAEIRAKFNIGNEVVFCWGEILYNPLGAYIDPYLQEHEETHSIQQQAIGVVAWWDRYLEDKDFRLSQESEAYRAQYAFAREKITDKDKLSDYLSSLAIAMSGEIYGNMCTYDYAINTIRNGKSY